MLYFIIFKYVPMYGILLAFKKYRISKGIWGSPWVGLAQFVKFFSNPSALQIMWNTFILSMYALFASIPIAVIMALALNETQNRLWRKSVQMVTYAPYFISTVVMVSILMQFMDPALGLFNVIRAEFGLEPLNFMGEPKLFRHIYVWSGIWQGMGWSAIIYIAALSGVDPVLYEAAIIDGATKLQRIIYIDLPSIAPTIVITFILSAGSIMGIGFEKAFLMQNPLNASVSEIIPTYVYKVGLISGEYGFSTAVGLFNSVINCVLLLTVNKIARRFGQSSIW